MLKTILGQFRSGPRTLSELTESLSLDHEELENRLDQLVRLGYLKLDHGMETHECECGCTCCQGCTGTISMGGYQITEKGRRVRLAD